MKFKAKIILTYPDLTYPNTFLVNKYITSWIKYFYFNLGTEMFTVRVVLFVGLLIIIISNYRN